MGRREIRALSETDQAVCPLHRLACRRHTTVNRGSVTTALAHVAPHDAVDLSAVNKSLSNTSLLGSTQEECLASNGTRIRPQNSRGTKQGYVPSATFKIRFYINGMAGYHESLPGHQRIIRQRPVKSSKHRVRANHTAIMGRPHSLIIVDIRFDLGVQIVTYTPLDSKMYPDAQVPFRCGSS